MSVQYPMTCLEVRREMAADPGRPSDALRRHLSECGTCGRALRRQQGFDRRLRDALAVPVPDGLAERLLLTQTTRDRSRVRRPAMALAASLVLALGVTWQFGIRPVNDARALNRYLAAHMNYEPEALQATTPVNMGTVERLLNEHDLHLSGRMDNIVYAKRCLTPNGTGVHLVIRTAQGPMTFIYMPEQHVSGRIDVEADGYRGYVTSFGNGTAVLVGTPSDTLEAIARQLRDTIRPPNAWILDIPGDISPGTASVGRGSALESTGQVRD